MSTSKNQPGERGALLTADEACAELRISRWMLYRLIQQRQLRSIKLGRRRLIPRTAIVELIDKLRDEEPALP